MKRVLSIALMMAFSGISVAGVYVEVGASAMSGCLVDYDEKLKSQGCSNNPFGIVAIGYQFEGFSLEVEHRSSLVEKDQGLNAINIKYRFEWK